MRAISNFKNQATLPLPDNLQPKTSEEIEEWLVNHLARVLAIDVEEIDTNIPFERYGLDSATGIGLTGELDEWLGRTLEPTLLYDYPTINALVKYLTE